jgi:hypothetical protein
MVFKGSRAEAFFIFVERRDVPLLQQRAFQIWQTIFAKEHLTPDKQCWGAKDPAIYGLLGGGDQG